jgi:hypothetical protein
VRFCASLCVCRFGAEIWLRSVVCAVRVVNMSAKCCKDSFLDVVSGSAFGRSFSSALAMSLIPATTRSVVLAIGIWMCIGNHDNVSALRSRCVSHMYIQKHL